MEISIHPLLQMKNRLPLLLLIFACFSNGKLLASTTSDSTRIAEMVTETKALLSRDLDSAYALAMETAIEAKKLGNLKAHAMSLKHKGLVHYYSSNHARAIIEYEKALKVFTDINDSLGMWMCKNNIAVSLQEIGDLDDGVQFQMDAIALARATGNRKNLAISLGNLANTQTDLKDYEGGLTTLKEALTINKGLDRKNGVANCYNGMASIFTELEEYDSSFHYHNMALELSLQDGNDKDIARSMMNLASAHLVNARYDSAQHYLDRSKPLLASANTVALEVHWHEVYGQLLKSRKQYPQALDSYQKGFDLATKYDLKNLANWIRLEIARTYRDQGNHETAFDSMYVYASKQARITQFNSIQQMQNLKMQFAAQAKVDSMERAQEIHLLEQAKIKAELGKSQSDLITVIVVATLIIFIMAALFIFSRYRAKQLKIKDESERLDLEHRLLRSQMDPHFLYNSMNAVQQYIGESDTFSAEVYLSRFAQLMRANLNHTRQERISLDEEIEALENYIQLEQVRFKDKFDYQIQVGSEVDPEMTSIPPMLIQPHIENAILHGLKNNASPGKLTLRISEQADHLTVEIEDNGRGRKAAGTQKSKEPETKHRSVAMKIIRERLERLNRKLGTHAFQQEIIDLYSDNGSAKGTLVRLRYQI